jgi:O-antigen ligase
MPDGSYDVDEKMHFGYGQVDKEMFQRKESKVLILLLIFAIIASALPTAVNILASSLLLVAVFKVTIKGFRVQRNIGSILVLLLVFWDTIRIIDPNVPSLYVGFFGLRLSSLALIGYLLGVFWPRNLLHPTKVIFTLMLVFASFSLVLNLIDPSISDRIVRNADTPTQSLFGIARYQGLFSGPFHASFTGAFLLLAAFEYPTKKLGYVLKFSAIAVGLITVLNSGTRTGVFACVLGAIFLVLGHSRKIFSLFIILLSSAVTVSLMLLNPNNFLTKTFSSNFIQSFFSTGSDRRFQNRFGSWESARNLFAQRPIEGWGTGSGASTLEKYFIGFEHIYPHNEFLKILVEGGLIGLIIFTLFLIFVITRLAKNFRERESLLISSFIILITFGSFGSALEALPWSFLLFVILGAETNKNTTSEDEYRSTLTKFLHRSK